jgi:molecular chaperone DnaJ
VEIQVPLERVLAGGEEQVRLNRPVSCSACHGTGGKDGAAPVQCRACAGTGRLTQSRREEKGQVLIQQITTCPTCHGRGSIIEHPCPDCGGNGAVEREESLTVKIPAGVEEGMALRIPGKGMPAQEAGGEPGDLYAVVRSRSDPRFERAGADLLRQEAIALVDAVLGTTLRVPTLEGQASVAVPAGTQPDEVLRLKGKGLPVFGGRRRGDLYLRIGVRVPESLSSEERQLYERLRVLGAGKH